MYSHFYISNLYCSVGMWLRQQQQSQRAIPDVPLPGRACQQGDPEGIPRLECVERPQHVVAVLPGLEPTGHTQKS